MPRSRRRLDTLLAAFRADPTRSGIFTDFDGTLSHVAGRPEEAVPAAGAGALLDQLATSYRTVAVVSGRPVAFLAPIFADDVLLSGLYGLELRRDGTTQVSDLAATWQPVIARVVAAATRELPPEILVEDKTFALTLHYRASPDLRRQVEQWADTTAHATGLIRAASKMSVELNLPVERDKGTVIAELATDLDRLCFLGDDRGDLPAFRELARLRSEGAETLTVAVRGVETPSEVLDAADVTVDGPPGALGVLRSLLIN